MSRRRPTRELIRAHQGRIAARVGEVLRARRQYMGQTLDEVAAGVGINPATLSKIENGKHLAAFPTLLAVCAFHGVHLGDLQRAVDVR